MDAFFCYICILNNIIISSLSYHQIQNIVVGLYGTYNMPYFSLRAHLFHASSSSSYKMPVERVGIITHRGMHRMLRYFRLLRAHMCDVRVGK